MSFYLSEDDEAAMGRYIEQVLESYVKGGVSPQAAQLDLAYAMTVAAIGDGAAFNKYIRLSAEERARV